MTLGQAFALAGNAAVGAADRIEDFMAELLSCPEHGRLRYRPDLGLWTCPGWDGEGCPSEWDPEAE